MATIISEMLAELSQYEDKRTENWPLVKSPIPIIVIAVSYLYFVLKLGPDYMKERKPYNLKSIITCYNVAQIISCSYIIYELGMSGWWDDYTLGCHDVDRSNNPKALRMANAVWWTLLLKFTELSETIFFVLRKKQNQISPLHMYHHISTLTIAWLCAKYAPGGMGTLCIYINCYVHVLMYSYYLLSLHSSKKFQQKLNQWKKYLTLIQMLQFCFLLIHAIQAFTPSCPYEPRMLLYTYVPNIFIVFYLFYDFYKKAYNKVK